jgi:hypothetical protein
MSITIDIKFTEQSVSLRSGVEDSHFSLEGNIPLPNLGDHIEFPRDGGVQAFLVIERVFSFQADGVTVRILLDVPA